MIVDCLIVLKMSKVVEDVCAGLLTLPNKRMPA